MRRDRDDNSRSVERIFVIYFNYQKFRMFPQAPLPSSSYILLWTSFNHAVKTLPTQIITNDYVGFTVTTLCLIDLIEITSPNPHKSQKKSSVPYFNLSLVLLFFFRKIFVGSLDLRATRGTLSRNKCNSDFYSCATFKSVMAQLPFSF